MIDNRMPTKIKTSSSAMAERPREASFAKILISGHPMGASGAIYALCLKFLTQRKLVVEFRREDVSFTRKTAN